MIEKLPPKEKIVEAWSAIVSDRISCDMPFTDNSGIASIKSSSGSKTYLVEWDGNIYRSNDRATFWQGYPGYPVIAILILRNLLPFNESLAVNFKDVNWTEINSAAGRDYSNALRLVEEERNLDAETIEAISKEIGATITVLRSLDIIVKRLVTKRTSR